MQISISFDEDILSEYERNGRPAFFRIRVVLNGRSFPDLGWMDFGCVILGWWLMACTQLLGGEDGVTFSFMDGPYRLRLAKRPLNDELACYTQDEELFGFASIALVVQAVRAAAIETIAHLSDRGIDQAGRHSLSVGIAKVDEFTIA